MKKLIALLLTALLTLSLLPVCVCAEANVNWAYGVTIDGVGTIYYARDYFNQEGIVNPLTVAPYTTNEITDIVAGATVYDTNYVFDLPADAMLGMNGFWYDAENTAAIVSHADPLSMNEEGVFSTADGTAVASPIVNWAYGITIDGVGTIWYGREYFGREGIINPLTVEPYTDEEVVDIVTGATVYDTNYDFNLPVNASLGMNGFWYDAESTTAITSHADPLSMNEEGVFFTADGTEVASPIAK